MTTDLDGILSLQRRNLPQVLSVSEQAKEGFVSVQHDISILKEMNELNAHTIAEFDGKVIGYALAMDRSFQEKIPMLISMFQLIDQALHNGNDYEAKNYLVMGQVCVDKSFRGQGLFKAMYDDLRNRFDLKYRSLITEVATRNKRSMRAHEKQGFNSILIHSSHGENWNIIQWVW